MICHIGISNFKEGLGGNLEYEKEKISHARGGVSVVTGKEKDKDTLNSKSPDGFNTELREAARDKKSGVKEVTNQFKTVKNEKN